MSENYKNKKTEFTFLGELSKEERKQAFKNAREFWNSLTLEERTQHLDVYYTAIREKKKENGGRLMKVSDFDVMRSMMVVCFSVRRASPEN